MPVKIHADPDMLRRALVNLVGNAIDAMRTAETLLRYLGIPDRREDTPSWSRIRVSASGGRTEKDLRAVLHHQGVGLGLGLVLRGKIVDAHGGEIFVDSTPGKGTRIEVALP